MSQPPQSPLSRTTIDVATGTTTAINASVLLVGGSNSIFAKAGAGTLDLRQAINSDYFGTFDIEAGTVQISRTNNLGVPLSRLNFRGDAAAADASIPRLAIAPADHSSDKVVIFTGTSSRSQRLIIGTYDTETSTWTQAASGGFAIDADRTLRIDNATYGATPATGGAILVGEGSRFVVDGGGTFELVNNRATDGGALYASPDSHVTLTNAIFTDNTAANNGGAIYNDRANVTLNYTQDAAITGNTGASNSGFIYMAGDPPGDTQQGGPLTATTTLDIATNKTLTIGSTATPTKDGITGIGKTTLNKDGEGTLNLFSRIQSHVIDINAGTLLLNGNTVMPGSANGGGLNIASGATLGGYGTVGAPGAVFPTTARNGSRIQIGHTGDTAPATLEITSLYLPEGGVTLAYDLFANNIADLLKSSVRLTSSPPPDSGTPAPANNPNIVELSNITGVGTWQLIQGTIQGLAKADINDYFTMNDPRITGSFSHTSIDHTSVRTDLHVTLSVADSPALIWTGATDATWATDAKTNWRVPSPSDPSAPSDPGTTPARFINGDRVHFDSNDTTGNRTLTIGGNGVIASEILVSGSGDYTFTGKNIKTTINPETFATGTISPDATGKLVKTGTGTLTLATDVYSNLFEGGIDHRGGTIAVTQHNELGANLDRIHFQGDVATDATNPTRIAIKKPQTGDPVFVFPSESSKRTDPRQLVIGTPSQPYAGGFVLDKGMTMRIYGYSTRTDTGNIDGGTIHLAPASRFTIEGQGKTLFYSNQTLHGLGGAIYAGQGSVTDLTNAEFQQNSARQGGAIYNDAAEVVLRYIGPDPAPNQILVNIAHNSTPATGERSAAEGGFLYMKGDAATRHHARTTFDIDTAHHVRIGLSNNDSPFNADTIASNADAHDYVTLVKTGAGILSINTDSSGYHGRTLHEAGTLVVNGILGSSLHTLDIASGATLKGDGRINGSVTLHAGATIAPGNSPGELTFENLVLEGGSILQLETGDIDDKITILGELSLSNVTAGNKINIELTSLPAPGTTLISFAALASGSALDDFGNVFSITGPGGDALTSGQFSITQDGGGFSISVAAVPEPETMALLLAAVAVGAVCLFRRNR
jgi:autotransporter-associated beta strand protein/predicted outer membrane repeat protein